MTDAVCVSSTELTAENQIAVKEKSREVGRRKKIMRETRHTCKQESQLTVVSHIKWICSCSL